MNETQSCMITVPDTRLGTTRPRPRRCGRPPGLTLPIAGVKGLVCRGTGTAVFEPLLANGPPNRWRSRESLLEPIPGAQHLRLRKRPLTMLPDWIVPILRCPESGQRFDLRGEALIREDGKVFPSLHGIASLVYPETLGEEDARWQRFYQVMAPFYDFSERVLGRLLTGVDMAKGRAGIVRLAGFQPGSQVLEVSPGPGVSHPLLREALGPASRIVAADLSLNMLRECRRRQGGMGAVPIQANALHLPFADESFDALFHFGGVNLFSDPGQALSEFVRVVRRGGRIVWGDEHMSERYSHPIGRRVLPRINPVFRKTPPAPPQGAEVLERHEVYGGLGYLVVAQRRG